MIYDTLIIGAGPAGLSASIYAARAGLQALTIEKNFVSGGHVIDTYQVESYPGLPGISGMDLAMEMQAHAERVGAQTVREEVTGYDLTGSVKKITTTGGVYESRSVILAMGAQRKKLGVPGEDRMLGHGVSYSATCDGAFYRGSNVAVIGSGDSAAADALYLARGSKKVYLAYKRGAMHAAQSLQDALKKFDNVEQIPDVLVEEIMGENHTGAVRLIPVKGSGKARTIHVDGVFIAIGISPETEHLPAQLERDRRGYLCAGEDGTTSVPGVFAIGDIRTKALRQILTSCADGANVVNSVRNYLLMQA